MLENSYIAMALFILGFGFLIFIHELGHFLAAKAVGIRCTQFAIGFGQALLCWRKGIGIRFGSTEPEYLKQLIEELDKDREDGPAADPDLYEQRLLEIGDERVDQAHAKLGLGETEYRLNYLPLGGYVKMLGQEDLDPSAQSASPRSFNSKSIPARALVISAGVIMNLITGFVVFVPAFLAGVDFPAAEVGMIAPDSPAEKAQPIDAPEGTPPGLQLGDTIIQIDGEPIRDMVDVGISIALAAADTDREVTVERPGLANPLTYVVTPKPDARREGLLSIGIGPSSTLDVAFVAENSKARNANIRKGMTLSSVNDRAITRFHELRQAVSDANGQPTTLTFTNQASAVALDIQPQPGIWYDDDLADIIGIEPATLVTLVVEDSPAARAGIQPGDVIARLGSSTFPTLSRLQSEVENANAQPMRLAVLRNHQTVDLGNITPVNGRIGVGIEPALAGGPVGERAAGKTSALPVGSSVDWLEWQRQLAGSNEGPITLSYQQNDASSVYIPSLSAEQRAQLRAAGWILPPLGIGFKDLQIALKGDSITEAVELGVMKTGDFMAQTYLTLLRLFQGSVQVANLRGPVGIVDEGQKVASRGWPYLLFFLGLISINLAVLNFLPLPIVDGGLMVFLMIEAIRGKPASVRIQQAATIAGLALLGCLFLYVTFNDLWRIFLT
ncbi:site-2 protease family protein [Mucisphaera calidilacus]|uniref:Regulator of sigma-E protease RseP n=1 Tax=Mucisphaera calidilacus TaxID=2527982 RepID=A0A518BVL7_9BACT|nr:site-2 protease family protein [Mucisphaera calidilacus]QDU70984.1 Regulator of sigma-E protease RseP [Mucisphaera calidilacus]